VRAVVLVGGEGTRLRPLTLGTPKQMLPIAEIPMIERVLGHLVAHGIDDVILAMGYKPDAFLEAFPDGTCAGASLTYAVEPEPMDTAGAVGFAARAAGVDDTFLVVNGDVLTDLDIGELVRFHRERGAEATISLTPVDDPSSFGVVPTDDDGRVQAFIEKPPKDQAPTNLINAGTYVLEPSVLDRIPSGQRTSIERQTFPSLVEERSLFAMASDVYWTDTGTPQLFLDATLDLVAGRRPSPPAPNAKERDDGVWTLGAAVIDGEVTGPALIGDAAFVGSGATVAGSVVGAGARVEPGARVEGAVLLPGAAVRAGALVQGSILGENVLIGEDAVVRGLTVVQGGAVVEAGATLDGERVAVR
jgi:mannose-1-phosphate guanylyltransferase